MSYFDIGTIRIGRTFEDPVFIKFINHKKDSLRDSDWDYEIQFFNFFICFGYNEEW